MNEAAKSESHPSLPERTDALIREMGVDAIIVSTRASIRHLSGVDYPHLSMVSDERSFVVWIAGGKQLLLAPGWGPKHARENSRLEVSFCNHPMTPIDHLIEVLRELDLGDSTVGMETEFVATAVTDRIRNEFPELKIQAADQAMLRSRVIKAPEEIEKTRASCRAAELGLIQAIAESRVGMTDREFSVLLRDAVLANGADSMAWLALRWGDGEQRMGMTDKPIEAGDLINVEMGCSVDGYHSDMQRMVAATTTSTEIEETNSNLWAVLNRSLLGIRPGMSTLEVSEAFRVDAEKAGLEMWDAFFLGHSVGLEAHEDYWIWHESEADLIIPDQSIFALEPMIENPTILSVEETVLVSESGNEILTSQEDWPDLPVLGQQI